MTDWFLYRDDDGLLMLAPELDVSLATSSPTLYDHFMSLRAEQSGLFAFALGRARHENWSRNKMHDIISLPYRKQLAAIGLPSSGAFRRLLSRIQIDRVELPLHLTQVADWLNSQPTVPKVLQHAAKVAFPWLYALSKQPAIALLPPPDKFGYEPADEWGMTYLEWLVTYLCDITTDLGWSAAQQQQLLSRLKDLNTLEDKLEDLKIVHQKHIWRKNRERVPIPFKAEGYIKAPRTLNDFEQLALIEGHCIDTYFERAMKGKCAIYIVYTGMHPALTAELVQDDNGLWIPVQIRAFHNHLADKKQLRVLFHWLAKVQADDSDHQGYQNNLKYFARRLGEITFKYRKFSKQEVLWKDQYATVIQLLKDEPEETHHHQMVLPLLNCNS